MNEAKITTDVAVSIISGWCDYFGEPIDADEIMNSSLLKAVMQGRVDFIEDEESFILQLRKPISLENGSTISTFTVKDPGAAHAFDRKTAHIKNKTAEISIDDSGKLFTAATGQPIGVLTRMSFHDNRVVDELLAFFR